MEADSVGVQAGNTCQHYWLLGDAARQVPGTCKKCGETRMFSGESWDTITEGGAMRNLIHNTAERNKQRQKTVDGEE